jgi:PAS domain S-box-containing protein
MSVESEASAAENADIRVLSVDDDPRFVDLTAEVLERQHEGMAVTTATSVEEGLAVLAGRRVDCVVSDYEMPGRSGLEFLAAVRETDPRLPFIIFTGTGSESVASEAFAAGATDYIRKQGDTQGYTLLAHRIESAVERARTDREREGRLAAIETAREGIAILDADGHFEYVNEAYAALYGYEPAEMVGEHWELVYPADERERARTEILPTVEREGRWHGTTTGLRADGDTFLEDHAVATTDTGGMVCTVRDVSEERAQADELSRYRTLVEALEDPVYAVDADGRFEYVNDAFLEMVGYDRETVIGSTPGLVKSEAAVETAEHHLGRILSSEGPDHARFELDIQPREGEPIRCEDNMVALPYEGERFAGSVGILRDISTRKARERRLERQNERLEEFASIVSHDLQNPLQVVSTRLELARAEADSEHLAEAAGAVERSQTLVDDLLTLARQGDVVGEFEPVALDTVSRLAWGSVSTDEATLTVETERAVSADPSGLQQLFTNLLANAVDHGGPTVEVTVGATDDGFYVADDGPGVDAEADVFAAGYTTAPEGTGYGLRIVERVAGAHDWTVTLAESEAGGARFEFGGVTWAD